MPTPPSVAVLLCLDGVVHDGDLAVQSFARHITDQLPAERVRPIIAGMRGFLEAKPELIPSGVDLGDAEDGYQAVEILARAAGVTADRIGAARRASRADLAASAWAVDPADGLDTLLAEFTGLARIAVLTEPGDPAAAAVLDSVGVGIDEIVERIEPGTGPRPVLVIGGRWTGQLADAQEAGCVTALVDRFGRDRGAPTFRSPDLDGLLEPIRRWLAEAGQQ